MNLRFGRFVKSGERVPLMRCHALTQCYSCGVAVPSTTSPSCCPLSNSASVDRIAGKDMIHVFATASHFFRVRAQFSLATGRRCQGTSTSQLIPQTCTGCQLRLCEAYEILCICRITCFAEDDGKCSFCDPLAPEKEVKEDVPKAFMTRCHRYETK